MNNNPLSYTDPSGYFFKKLWKDVKKLSKKIFRKAKDWSPTYHVYKETTNFALKTHFRLHEFHSKHIRYIEKTDEYIGTHKWAQQVGSAVATYYGGPIGTAAFSAHVAYTQGTSINQIRQLSVRATATSMAVGGVTQGMNLYQRVIFGGVLSRAQGGKFIDGFKVAGIGELSKVVYSKLSQINGYNENGEPHLRQEGKSDVGKQLRDIDIEDIQNGLMKAPLLSDQSTFMQTMARGPYMDAFAEFHDGLHDLRYVPADQVSLILTMAPSYVLTLAAAMQPYTYQYILDEKRD